MTTAIDRLFNVSDFVTEEEREWQRKAREFANTKIKPIIEKEFEDRRLPLEVVAEMADAGFIGMHIDGYGCAGASAVAYGLVAVEMEAADSGFRTAMSVLGSLSMGAIAKFGSEQQKQQWLPKMAKAKVIGCFGLTEPQGGSDPSTMITTARRDGDDWILNGSKRWIGLVTEAHIAIVWARDEENVVRGFIVPTDTPGFTARPIVNKLAMRASLQCEFDLENVRIPQDALLPGTRGLGSAFKCLNDARYGIAWGALGAARDSMEAVLTRIEDRKMFGEPLGAKQLVQKKLADSFVEYEKGLLLALHLGRLKDAGKLSYAQISVGKLNNVREAIKIVHTCRGLLGGDGITSDFPVMRHMANLEAVSTYEGTEEVHTLVLGRELTGIPAF